jgi:A/G-specific adenine glycosylase
MTAPFRVQLLLWYDQEADALPWRSQPPNPYHIWLSEIMLQQTQVETVIPYYARFLATYPTIHTLAEAPIDDVLKLWEGLGYYSRARHLQQTAQIISNQFAGKLPQTLAELQQLPGIGRYTAGAIASIAFNQPAPIVDGNVIRVFSRLTDLKDDVRKTATKNHLWQLAEDWVPTERPGDYNQALMELGRRICKPRNPLCDLCPIQSHCRAHKNNTQHQRPVKAKKAPVPHINVAAGIIYDPQGRILIAQRNVQDMLGGLWEFPGGKQKPDETLPQTLQRELREELAIEVAVDELFVVVKHAYTHFKMTMHTFKCRHIGGEPQKVDVQNFAWVTEEDFDQYAFGKADRLVIEALQKRRDLLI